MTRVLNISMRKIDRLKKWFVVDGLEVALNRTKGSRISTKKADRDFEAHLVTLSCSEPPEGFARWSLRLLSDKAIEQRKGKVNPRIDGGTWVFIETLIRKDWSSEHIHSWMKENMGVTVSHEWIYQYILQDKQTGGDLYTHLRCRKKEVELVTGKQIPLSVKDINKLWSH